MSSPNVNPGISAVIDVTKIGVKLYNTDLRLLYKDSRSAYLIASHQYTLTSSAFEVLRQVLKPEIVSIIDKISKNLVSYRYIHNYEIKICQSGMWVSNTESEWYDKNDICIVATWNNRVIVGTIDGNPVQYMLMYIGKKFVIDARGAVHLLGTPSLI